MPLPPPPPPQTPPYCVATPSGACMPCSAAGLRPVQIGIACQVLTPIPRTNAATTTAAAANATLLRRHAFWSLYAVLGGRATTGSDRNCLPGADTHSQNQCRYHHRRRRKRHLIASPRLLEPVCRARRPGYDRFRSELPARC